LLTSSTGATHDVGSSSEITLSTGDAVGGTAGGLNDVEVGSFQDNEDAGSSIEKSKQDATDEQLLEQVLEQLKVTLTVEDDDGGKQFQKLLKLCSISAARFGMNFLDSDIVELVGTLFAKVGHLHNKEEFVMYGSHASKLTLGALGKKIEFPVDDTDM